MPLDISIFNKCIYYAQQWIVLWRNCDYYITSTWIIIIQVLSSTIEVVRAYKPTLYITYIILFSYYTKCVTMNIIALLSNSTLFRCSFFLFFIHRSATSEYKYLKCIRRSRFLTLISMLYYISEYFLHHS